MRLYTATSSFTRPANTTNYSSTGRLIANDTVAGNVVPMTFVIPAQGFLLTGVKITTNNISTIPAQFYLNLFQFPPVSSVGDGGIFSVTESGFLGQIYLTCNFFSDLASGQSPVDPNLVPIFTDTTAGTNPNQIYGYLETAVTYNSPVSGQVFTVELIGVD